MGLRGLPPRPSLVLVLLFASAGCASRPRAPEAPPPSEPIATVVDLAPTTAPVDPTTSPTSPEEPAERVAPAEPTACALASPTGVWPEKRGAGHDRWIPGLYSYDARAPGRVALTFDDGPNRYTQRVLDVLAAHGAKATFFVVGKSIWAGTMPLIQRMVREGHALGNHTYRHDFTWGFRTNPRYARRFFEAEITLTQIRVDLALLARDGKDFDALDARVFGRWGRFLGPDTAALKLADIEARHAEVLAERNEGRSPYPMLLVRPPYGRPFFGGPDRDRLLFAETLNRMGILHILWHGSNGDSDPALPPATRFSSRFLVNRMSLLGSLGGVVLAHDRMPRDALDLSLKAYAAEGVTVVPLDEVLAEKFGCASPAALWAALRHLAATRSAGPDAR